MIPLTRLNHTRFYLNAALIEHIESTPDTVITLTSGQKFVVMESVEEVVARFAGSQHLAPKAVVSEVTGDSARG